MSGGLRIVLQHRLRLVRELLAWYAVQRPDFDVIDTVDRPYPLLEACSGGQADVVFLECDSPPWNLVELVLLLREHHLQVVGLRSTVARRQMSAQERVILSNAGVSEFVAYDESGAAVLAALRALRLSRPGPPMGGRQHRIDVPRPRSRR